MLLQFARLLLVLSLCFATVSPGFAGKLLRIKLPDGFDASKASVFIEQLGKRIEVSWADHATESNELKARISDDAKSVKWIVYYPGCRLIHAESKVEDIPSDEAIVADLVRLPTISLTMKVTKRDGHPVADTKLTIWQSLRIYEYFGIMGGPVYDNIVWPLATGTTGIDGTLTVRLPRIIDDPALALNGFPKPEYFVDLDTGNEKPFRLFPAIIDAKAEYTEPVVINLVYSSRISGKVPKSLLEKYNIKAPFGKGGPDGSCVLIGAEEADGSGSSVLIDEDGSFSIGPITPGTYTMFFEVRTGDCRAAPQRIPIEKNVILKEDTDMKISLK